MTAFFFKLHGHKHTFEAQTPTERNGWFIAVEKAIEEAKAAKQGIVESESYKEELSKLGEFNLLVARRVAINKLNLLLSLAPAAGSLTRTHRQTRRTSSHGR